MDNSRDYTCDYNICRYVFKIGWIYVKLSAQGRSYVNEN